MSKLFNYFVSCWKFNANFGTVNLDNAVLKGLITEDEKTQIEAIEREI